MYLFSFGAVNNLRGNSYLFIDRGQSTETTSYETEESKHCRQYYGLAENKGQILKLYALVKWQPIKLDPNLKYLCAVRDDLTNI